jgi:hypothetical protein
VVERKRSNCKYVEIFTHHVGSTGAPKRIAVFSRGANTKHEEVPNIVSRNTKSNIFRKGSTGFKATIHLNKKKCIKVLLL